MVVAPCCNRCKKQLEALGSTLIIRKGRTEEEILSLIEQLDITAVYWNICYDRTDYNLIKNENDVRG